MQTHAKHQQHDPDFRELARERGIRHEARGEGADHDAGQQIADQCGQLEANGNETEYQRQAERGSNGGDEFDAVGHGR